MSIDSNYLLRRIDELDRWWERTHGAPVGDDSVNPTLYPWQYEDAADLAIEVAHHTREHIDLPALEHRLTRDATLDVDALKVALKILEDADYEFTFATDKKFEPKTRLKNLESLVATLDAPQKVTELEVILRLSFWGDMPIDALLMGAKDTHALAGRLEPLVMKKLKMLSDDDALDLLQQYVAETDPARTEPIPVPAKVRHELGSVAGPDDARHKIARYLLRERPLAVRCTLETRESAAFPVPEVGVARVLTWTQDSDPAPLTRTQLAVVKHLGRLGFIWTSVLRATPERLSTALGCAPDGALLSGRARADAKDGAAHGEVVPNWSALVYVLRALIDTVGEHARDAPRSIAALWAHKLGLEVMLPAMHGDVRGKGELLLQQELCRFLLERDVHAYGKRFGNAQEDLRVDDAFGTLIIETKKTGDPPTEISLRRALSQLLSYMDQEPMNHRGALVIYNLSKVPLITERRVLLVKRRVYIVPINLLSATPSQRGDAVEIVESDDPKTMIGLRRPLGPRRKGTRHGH